MKSNVDTVIETLVNSHCGPSAAARQKHLLRESLRALVRLAQAEQMRDIRANVKKLTMPVLPESGASAEFSPQGVFDGAINKSRSS